MSNTNAAPEAQAPATRFEVISTEPRIVRDNQTGLMWGPTLAETLTHKKAQQAVAELSTGGFTDWRLPTRAELLTLVDDTQFKPAIDTEAFSDTKSDWYWTSTPDASNPDDCAWVVAFGYGHSYFGSRGNRNFVRPVRASQ